MHPARFTIAGLMGVVLVAGVGIAALRSPSALWDGALFTAALIALGVASLGAFQFRGRARASWAGFAVFGFAYLGLTSGPWTDSIRPRLATTQALEELGRRLHSEKPPTLVLTSSPNTVNSLALTLRSTTSTIAANNVQFWTTAARPIDFDRASFQPIGHSLWAMLAAIFGGAVGGWLFGIAERRREDEARIAHLRQIGAADLSVSSVVANLPGTGPREPLSG